MIDYAGQKSTITGLGLPTRPLVGPRVGGAVERMSEKSAGLRMSILGSRRMATPPQESVRPPPTTLLPLRLSIGATMGAVRFRHSPPILQSRPSTGDRATPRSLRNLARSPIEIVYC